MDCAMYQKILTEVGANFPQQFHRERNKTYRGPLDLIVSKLVSAHIGNNERCESYSITTLDFDSGGAGGRV